MIDRDMPLDGDDAGAQPTRPGEPQEFRPEGAEFEPAGGIIQKPPAPEEPEDRLTEGDT